MKSNVSDPHISICYTFYKHLNQNPARIWTTTRLNLWLCGYLILTDTYVNIFHYFISNKVIWICILLLWAGTFSNRLWKRQLSFWVCQATDWNHWYYQKYFPDIVGYSNKNNRWRCVILICNTYKGDWSKCCVAFKCKNRIIFYFCHAWWTDYIV